MASIPLAIDVRTVSKTFTTTRALVNVDLRVAPGEMVALIGPSGSGKSTLLRHLSGLEASDTTPGAIILFGKTVQRNGRVTPQIRQVRAEVGYIFQQFHLVGRLSLLTNVLVGMLAQVPLWRGLLGWFTYAETQRAMAALARVDMAAYATQRASTLSGGQQQRGAIARAMMQGARIILADEPIASLDPESARKVMVSLAQLNSEDGVTVLVSLHQIAFARRYCPRVVALKEGLVVYDGASADLTSARLHTIYGADVTEFYADDGAYASVAMPDTAATAQIHPS